MAYITVNSLDTHAPPQTSTPSIHMTNSILSLITSTMQTISLYLNTENLINTLHLKNS